MLRVKTPEETLAIIENEFCPLTAEPENVPLSQAAGRILAADVTAREYVPNFDRSTVDGYTVKASDTFGCCDSMPAVLALRGKVEMGMDAAFELKAGECAYVPTGGSVPLGADAGVMIEYSEDYGDGTVGILKPAAPGQNLIFRGDDVFPGKVVLPAGRRITTADIGALAALGMPIILVRKKPLVGIISTGDELVPVGETPQAGQVRDVNTALLCAAVSSYGGEAVPYGAVRDGYDRLSSAVKRALRECDAVLISGGSSVGVMDSTCRVIEDNGTLLLHGIAMKPGKPTIIGKIGEKPVFGLPGHPVAAHFVAELFVRALMARLLECGFRRETVCARLSEKVSANNGRAQYMGVFLENRPDGLWAVPVRTKSGLITALAGTDGYFCIPRDCEGLQEASQIEVYTYSFC